MIHVCDQEFLKRLENQARAATEIIESPPPLILVTQGGVPYSARTYAPIRNVVTDRTFDDRQPIVVLQIDAEGVSHDMLKRGWRPS